jgi:hypothetical protein
VYEIDRVISFSWPSLVCVPIICENAPEGAAEGTNVCRLRLSKLNYVCKYLGAKLKSSLQSVSETSTVMIIVWCVLSTECEYMGAAHGVSRVQLLTSALLQR